ncbi:MAG: trimeric intracellular cation channel family protein [Oscillospiraceae bacterium]|nr:trimeric intracellular cation channel family protein [Oscillospiraceae bacterium]
MLITNLTYFFCDFVGTAAFAISGAMVACRKGADLFGVIFLTEVTSLGGGMLRDVLLGRFPPALFTNWTALITALVMALVVFFSIHYHHDAYLKETTKVAQFNRIVDSAGLGLFAVVGCQVAIQSGHEANGFLVIMMGMLTAVGGGLLRDVLIREIPYIFTKHVYAVAAIAGACVYYLLFRLNVAEPAAVILGTLTTFTLRCLAAKYRWNLPRP